MSLFRRALPALSDEEAARHLRLNGRVRPEQRIARIDVTASYPAPVAGVAEWDILNAEWTEEGAIRKAQGAIRKARGD